jgi:Uma2 family endonuclease
MKASNGARRSEVDLRALDGRRMSEAEYLALPVTMRRMELVDGLVVCEPSATDGHQAMLGGLYDELRGWTRMVEAPATLRFAPLDVRFGANRILQPDLFVFLEPLPRDVKTPIERIPDLCVEIVSRRHAYDRITKRQMYAEAGVRELWTVIEKQRLVERWTGPDLATLEECREHLTTPLLPGFDLDVAALFAR